jgi:hypothetical protein
VIYPWVIFLQTPSFLIAQPDSTFITGERLCHQLFEVMVVFGFVDDIGIIDHHCLNFFS